MRTLLVLFVLAAISGCNKEAEKSTPVGREFVVDFLFEFEGCRVYRFGDGGYLRYFTNCSGSVSWEQQAGKHRREMSVEGGKP